MKAAVMRGTQQFAIEDIPTPEPGPNQVLIKIRYSAICGSDVHRFQYGMANSGSVLGHEYIGEVVQTGQDVTRLKEGDRIVGGGGTPPVGMQGVGMQGTVARGESVSFPVDGVIPGFRDAILGMKVGGQRRVYIPSELGYGAAGAAGAIPPNADLVFDIVLEGVR